MKRLLLLMALILALAGNALGDETPEASTGFGQPMSGYVETGYTYLQWSTVSGCYHPGSDYNGSGTSGDGDLGWDVLAVAKGKVVDVINNASFGLCLTIEHKYYDTTVYSQYAHLQSVLVSVNDIVDKGEHVAELGNSGTSCGTGKAHLHWEIRIGGSGKHPDPDNADYWNTSSFQSRTNIKNWYENPSLWCAKHKSYDDIQDKFDDVVQRNGQGAVGTATNSIHWYGPYLRQDFSGGTFGSCCILYDPYNEVDNPDATDEAYLLRTGFYVHYFAGDGDRWEEFGCPSRDEYHPETGADGDAIQFFVKRVWLADEGDYHDVGRWETQFHYMYFEANLPTNEPPDEVISWHSVYETDYVSQNPAGQFTMQQGETKTFTVSFRNESQFTWHNNPSSYPYDYVELKSCDDEGATCESFLNYPYSSGLGWLNNISPCTMQESSVAPGGVATFTFTGKVDASAALGLHLVYFRVNHSVGGLMEGWDGMHFQVYVLPELSGDDFVAFVGNFNGDGKDDICLYDVTNDRWFVAVSNGLNRFTPIIGPGTDGAWLEGWADGHPEDYIPFVGDFSGDGYCDIGMYHKTLGRWFIAFNWNDYFEPESGTQTGGSWLSSWKTSGSGTEYVPYAADFSGDGYCDIALMQKVYGRWFVAYNWNDHFTPVNGSGANYSWLDGWGQSPYTSFVRDFNGDDLTDVCVYHPTYGRWFVARKNGNNFTAILGPYTGGSWLTSWEEGGHIPYVGDFSGDGYCDAGVIDTSIGRWSVAFNWNDRFTVEYGTDDGYSWISPWGAGNDFDWLVGDFSGDGYDDICVHEKSTGNWFVAFNWDDHFLQADGIDDADFWLSGWGIVTGGFAKVADPQQGILPSTFTLNQNYPNPFNPMTVISYSLPEASDVKLDVFNILGQRVITLINQKQEAGEHTITWDASSVASGVYFYRIQTAEATETKKMLLLK